MKKKITLCAFMLLCILSLIIVPIIATADSNNLDENNAEENYYNNLYESPTIGNITGEGSYPDEKNSSTSDSVREKSWFEYVAYSIEPFFTVTTGLKERYVYYDPYDYSYGLIMEVGESLNNGLWTNGNEFVVESETSSSTIDVITGNITRTYELSTNAEASIGYGIKDIEWTEVKAQVQTSTKWEFGVDTSHTTTTIDRERIETTFYAAHFNSNGGVYQWRVVHYTVYLPIKVVRQYFIEGDFEDSVMLFGKEGKWVNDDSSVAYIQLATVEGLCREFIKNEVVYIEHWGTGEPVVVDNFWDGFLTAEGIIKAYQDKLFPNTK